jgi:hypothetical protein
MSSCFIIGTPRIGQKRVLNESFDEYSDIEEEMLLALETETSESNLIHLYPGFYKMNCTFLLEYLL